MTPRKRESAASAPLGPVAAEWLEQASAGSYWTADERRALVVAAQHLDRAEKARAQIETDGMTTVNSRGSLVGHPLLSFEVSNRAAFTKLLRELDLIGDGSEQESSAAASSRLSAVRAENASFGARHRRGQV